jgi:hypothetical protein
MAFGDARQCSITTICVLPGSNVIGGWGVVLRTVGRIGRYDHPGGKPGLKAVWREPRWCIPREGPSTRMGTAFVVREACEGMGLKQASAGKKDKERCRADLGMEALLMCWTAGDPRCHAHNAYDIVTAIRIARVQLQTYADITPKKHLILNLARKGCCSVGPSGRREGGVA